MWESDIDAAILANCDGIAPDDWSDERTAAAIDFLVKSNESVPVVPASDPVLDIPSMDDILAMETIIDPVEFERLKTLRQIRDSSKRNRENSTRAELRARQDAEFEASLAADRLKDIEKARKELEEHERPEREAQEARERIRFLREQRCAFFTNTKKTS
jgi:hypothetical protein